MNGVWAITACSLGGNSINSLRGAPAICIGTDSIVRYANYCQVVPVAMMAFVWLCGLVD